MIKNQEGSKAWGAFQRQLPRWENGTTEYRRHLRDAGLIFWTSRSLSIGIQNVNSELQRAKLGIVPGLYWELGLNQSQRERIKMKARAAWALLSAILILGKGEGVWTIRPGKWENQGRKEWAWTRTVWLRDEAVDAGCGCVPGSTVFSVLGLSTSLTNGSGECGDTEKRLPHFLDSSCYKEEQGWNFLISTNLIPPCSTNMTTSTGRHYTHYHQSYPHKSPASYNRGKFWHVAEMSWE